MKLLYNYISLLIVSGLILPIYLVSIAGNRAAHARQAPVNVKKNTVKTTGRSFTGIADVAGLFIPAFKN